MKSVLYISIALVLSISISAQTHVCTLMSPSCCEHGEENEYFEMVPVVESEVRSNGAEIFINQVPIVHYNSDNITRYPLEIRVVADQEVLSATMEYYDFETFSILEGDLFDDGMNLDAEAGDGTLTSIIPIVQSRNIRNEDTLYHYSLISGTLTLNYVDGSTEEFRAKIDGYTIIGDSIELDTTNVEIGNIGSFYFTDNAVNYVMPQEYSENQLNFPVRDVLSEFREIWPEYKDAHVVFSSPVETNDGNRSFRSSASPPGKYILNVSSRGMSQAHPLNHEINHFWIYQSAFNFFSNHLRYVERPQSGFGYDCYNGVLTEIYEEDGIVKFNVDEADNPHENFFNDIELNLMGVLPVDSVAFPIKYYDRTSAFSTDCNSTFNTLSDGSIEYLTKEEYVDFTSNVELLDASEGFDLKFIFLTEEPLTKVEHAFLEYLVPRYADIFKESTSDLIDLNTEINSIVSDVNDDSQNNLDIAMYPNPTSEVVTIDFGANDQGQLSIFNMTGQIIQSGKLRKGQNKFNINLLPAGIYIVSIMNDQGMYWADRLVKY